MNTIATLIILLLFPLLISAHEFEYQFLDSPSKEANVIVTSQTLSRNSTVHLNRLIGRVFNRGEETAHNVVVRYEVHNADGAVVMRGKIPSLPKNIPGKTYADFNGKIVGRLLGPGEFIYTVADWGK